MSSGVPLALKKEQRKAPITNRSRLGLVRGVYSLKEVISSAVRLRTLYVIGSTTILRQSAYYYTQSPSLYFFLNLVNSISTLSFQYLVYFLVSAPRLGREGGGYIERVGSSGSSGGALAAPVATAISIGSRREYILIEVLESREGRRLVVIGSYSQR